MTAGSGLCSGVSGSERGNGSIVPGDLLPGVLRSPQQSAQQQNGRQHDGRDQKDLVQYRLGQFFHLGSPDGRLIEPRPQLVVEVLPELFRWLHRTVEALHSHQRIKAISLGHLFESPVQRPGPTEQQELGDMRTATENRSHLAQRQTVDMTQHHRSPLHGWQGHHRPMHPEVHCRRRTMSGRRRPHRCKPAAPPDLLVLPAVLIGQAVTSKTDGEIDLVLHICRQRPLRDNGFK